MKTTLNVIGLLLLTLLSLPLVASGSVATVGDGTDVTYTLGAIADAFAPPFFAVLALTVLAGAAGGSSGSVRRALRALIGLAREEERVAAAGTLANLARLAQGIGLSLSLVAAVSAFVLVRQVLGDPGNAPAPATVASFLTWSVLPAAVGLAAARLLLAPRADAMFARAGAPRRAFTPGEDFGLFAMIAPVLITLVPFFLEAKPL